MDDEQTSVMEPVVAEKGTDILRTESADRPFYVSVQESAVGVQITAEVGGLGRGRFYHVSVRSAQLAVKILDDIYAEKGQIIQSVIDGTGWETRFVDEVNDERAKAKSHASVRTPRDTQKLKQDVLAVREHLKQLRIRYVRPKQKQKQHLHENEHATRKQRTPPGVRWSKRLKELSGASFALRTADFNQCRPPEHELGKRELFFSEGPVAKPVIKKSKDPEWPWVVSHYVPTESEAVHELRIPCMYQESAVVWRNETASVVKGMVDEILWRNASEIWRAIQIGQETLCSRMTICDEWSTLAGFVNHFGICNFVDKTVIFIIDSGIGLHPGNCHLGRVDSKQKRRFLDDCEQILRYVKLGLCSLEDVDSFSRIDADPDVIVAAMKALETRTKTLSQPERKKQFAGLLMALVDEHGSIGPEELVTRFAIRGGMRRMKLELHGKAMNRPDTYLEQLESMRGPSTEELFALDHEDVEEQADEELAVL